MIAGYICTTRTYHYNGWDFEYGYNCWPLKKNGELRARCGRKFLNDIEGFLNYLMPIRNNFGQVATVLNFNRVYEMEG